MLKTLLLGTAAWLGFLSGSAAAWNDGGHMLVAYIAYNQLTPQIRTRVDQLLKLNPMYKTWINGVSADQQGLTAFVHAATWPDCIKSRCKGYQDLGGDTPPGKSTDAQNIGYKDKLMHKYWHFVDHPYSAGAPGRDPATPNAETQIQLFIKAIGSRKSDNIKSYDVVWLEHLVGDVHQPLHATSRFTKNHPMGDNGGNSVKFCDSPCRDELHAYWDDLLGNATTVKGVGEKASPLMSRPKPAGADDLDVAKWTDDSLSLAESAVYVSPIFDDNDPNTKISPRPDDSYHQAALAAAQSQVLLGGYRLAALLNQNLK